MAYFSYLASPIKKYLANLLEFPEIKTVIAVIGSVASYFLHENLIGLLVLVGLVIVDQITGVWLALRDDKFTSSIFRNGLLKLLFYMVIIASFHSLVYISPLIDYLQLDIVALMYLAGTEAISITENSCEILGIPFPGGLLTKMRSLFKLPKSRKPKK